MPGNHLLAPGMYYEKVYSKSIYLTACHVDPELLNDIFDSGEDYYFWADEALEKFGLIQAIV